MDTVLARKMFGSKLALIRWCRARVHVPVPLCKQRPCERWSFGVGNAWTSHHEAWKLHPKRDKTRRATAPKRRRHPYDTTAATPPSRLPPPPPPRHGAVDILPRLATGLNSSIWRRIRSSYHSSQCRHHRQWHHIPFQHSPLQDRNSRCPSAASGRACQTGRRMQGCGRQGSRLAARPAGRR